LGGRRISEGETSITWLPDPLTPVRMNEYDGLGIDYGFCEHVAEVRLVDTDEARPVRVAPIAGNSGFGEAKIGEFAGG